MSDNRFAGLNFLIQYRHKERGVVWHNMAAFDVVGPAERYLRQQETEGSPWEYQLVDIDAGTTVRRTPQENAALPEAK